MKDFEKQNILELNCDKVWIAGVKLWADGPPHHGATMVVNELYLESWLGEILSFPPSPNRGILNHESEILEKMITHFHNKNFQIAIHAQGERAIDQVLSIYEKLIPESNNKDYHYRHRLEHFTLPTEAQMMQCAKLGIMTSFFVYQLFYYGKTFSELIFGNERTNRWAPLASALKHGCKISLHQDTPTFPGPPLPFYNLMTAVTRKCSLDNKVYGPDQCISVHEALKAFTIYPAFQIFKEKELGSLEVGKMADLLIISEDPYKIPHDDLSKIKVLATYLGGVPTFKNDSFNSINVAKTSYFAK